MWVWKKNLFLAVELVHPVPVVAGNGAHLRAGTEPSTGVVMKLSEAQGRYQTIESVFNHENMWVNMQSRDLSLQEMGYDLWDLRKWEFIIVSSSKLSGEDGGADYGTQSGNYLLRTMAAQNSCSAVVYTVTHQRCGVCSSVSSCH